MHKLIDFNEGIVPTPEWLGRQPKNVDAVVVQPKNDSGADDLVLAKGEGRHGNDCLLVRSTTDAQGLPGFWLAKYVSTGRGVSNLSNDRGYLLPRGIPANRFSCWLRFDAGFRAKSSLAATKNLIVGTYHYDPAKLGSGPVKETNNWHFYHQLSVRHAQAGGGWIHVVVNDLPTHQRSVNQGFPVANPTQVAGNYWEICTRLYLDCNPYHGSPEIDYPVRMFVDDVCMDYVAPRTDLRCAIKGGSVVIAKGRTTKFNVELWNDTTKPVTGVIGHRSRYSWTPAIVDPFTEKSVHKQRITLQPGLNQLELHITPRDGMKTGTTMMHGVVFVPDSEARPGNHSHADPNVQMAPVYAVTGPSDCSPIHAAVNLRVE